MSERNLVFAVTTTVAICIIVAVIVTIIHLFSFATGCAAEGGTFSNEGTTAWCRH